MADEKQMIHDLLKIAINNNCYITWVGVGTTLGSLVEPGLGTLVGFAAGVLWASYTCKPILENTADPQRFISEVDFRLFHLTISAYYPISRDEAFALAYLASTQSPGVNSCSAPPNVGIQFEKLFSVARA